MTNKIFIIYLLTIIAGQYDLMSQNLVTSKQSFSDADKIIITTKIYGLLEKYEPKAFTAAIDLKAHFIAVYPQFQQVTDSQSFYKYLEVLLKPFNRSISPQELKLLKISDKVQHPIVPDFEWIEDERISEPIRYQLYDILSSYRPNKRNEIKIKEKYTIIHSPTYPTEADSLAMFTLGMIKFWNDVYYYFPYINLMDEPWTAVLEKEANRIIAAQTLDDYYENLKLLAAYMDDSHVHVTFNKYQVWAYGFNTWMTYPIVPGILEDNIYVKGVANREYLKGIQPGDIITHINGLEAKSYLTQQSLSICASNKYDSIQKLQWRILPNYNHPDLGDSIVSVTINGKAYNLRAEPVNGSDFNEFMNLPKRNNFPKVSEINDSTGYIHLTENTGREVNKAFKSFSDKKNLILDLRGYPKNSLVKFMARNLSNKEVPVASFYYPDYNYPGYFKNYAKNVTYYVSNNLDFLLLALFQSKGKIFPSMRKPYAGKLIVLIDEQAISYSETIGMIIKSYRPDAIFVGRPSNGANGNVTEIILPYNISVSMSGLHWHFADGSQLQRVGLKPDHLVVRSHAEIINNEDKILASALEIINETKISKSNKPLLFLK
ncbi:MAG: S41 family peptidase [Ignavibacterium sp.]|jgi:C-terminal processing protease CtpA/Prc|nr:S41 family peptidase [Ignavibacterium sp.]